MSPFNKATAAKYKEVDGFLESMWKEANSVPTAIEPIDWEAYRKVIKAPGVVDQLKKEYESKSFPVLEDKKKATIQAYFKQLVSTI